MCVINQAMQITLPLEITTFVNLTIQQVYQHSTILKKSVGFYYSLSNDPFHIALLCMNRGPYF